MEWVSRKDEHSAKSQMLSAFRSGALWAPGVDKKDPETTLTKDLALSAISAKLHAIVNALAESEIEGMTAAFYDLAVLKRHYAKMRREFGRPPRRVLTPKYPPGEWNWSIEGLDPVMFDSVRECLLMVSGGHGVTAPSRKTLRDAVQEIADRATSHLAEP